MASNNFKWAFNLFRSSSKTFKQSVRLLHTEFKQSNFLENNNSET